MTHRSSPLVGLGLWAVGRPWSVLIAGAAIAALSVLAVTRIHATGSIESMLSQDASARALAHVFGEFGVLDELILLVTAPAATTMPPEAHAAQDRLLAFAKRLSEEIEQSKELSAMCDDVTYGPPADLRSFVAERIVPSAMLYVADDTLAELAERLTAEGIRRQIREDEAMLSASGVAGHTLAKTILRDPLRLHELLLKDWGQRIPSAGPLQAPWFLSMDGRTLMIRIAGSQPASDLEFSKALTRAIGGLAAHLRDTESPSNGPPHVETPAPARQPLGIEFTGAYAIAVLAESSIRSDMISSTTGSVALLLLLFLVIYRSVSSFLLAMVPVAFGILTAFAISSLFFTQLTPVVGVIGAVLAGLAIDYSIHFLSLFAKEQARGANACDAVRITLAEIAPALTAGCATSILGFLAITFSSVWALGNFALLGALGLAGALLGAVTLLPAMICVSSRPLRMREPRLLRSVVVPLVHWIMSQPRGCALAVAVGTLVAAAPLLVSPGAPLELDHDLSVMHPRPNRPLELQHDLARRFGVDPDAFVIHLQAPKPDQLLTLAHRVDQALRGDEVRLAGVSGVFGPASLLPDPAGLADRQKALSQFDAERVISDLRAALAESVFDPAAFGGYIEFLRRFLAPTRPPDWAALREYPAVARLVLSTANRKQGRPATQAIAIATSREPLTDRGRRDRAIAAVRGALADLPGATLTGISVVGHDTEQRIYGNVARLLVASVALSLGYLVIFYRSLSRAALAMLPMAVGLACLAGWMNVFGLRLNMVNLIGLPILVGIGVDAGIFLVSLAENARRARCSPAQLRERLGAGSHSLLMTTLSTVLGFGTLTLTSTPAIRSLGVMLGVGMTGCLVAAVFLLVSLLTIGHEVGHPAERPAGPDA